MDIPQSLISGIRQRQVILFAGAGLSRHLGLPLFDILKRHLAEKIGINSEDLEYPILAEYYLLKVQDHEELWSWMREVWTANSVDIRASAPHRAIVELGFPVIYTTNYDSWIEAAFTAWKRLFHKIVRVKDLATVRHGTTEIVKFHGDFEDPETIVLTESSFLRRMSLDGPLDIRLRADSLAKPILFVGYSMSDPNIRYLLFKLRQIWEQQGFAPERPLSYLLMTERDRIAERLLQEQGVQPIFNTVACADAALTAFFQSLQEVKIEERSAT